MAETEAVPDDLRCNRSDGRKWRCKRRSMVGKKMCEIHHLQLNLRQHRQKVPESLKLVRSKKVAESLGTELNSGIRARRSGKSGKTSKRKRIMGEAEAVDEAVRKMKLKRGDTQLDLIRMVLKREVEKMKKPSKKKKKKNKKESNREFDDSEGSDEDMMRFLPNGVMAISSSSPNTSNAASPCDIKVGAEPISVSRRRFRSKNIEPFPVGKMQVAPFKENLVNARKEKKKKKCHWCGSNGFGNLICCLNCKREFFCLDCIEKRNAGSRKEVERECPICRGSCECKACSGAMSGVTQCKDVLITRSEIDRVLHLHYLICMLLPVLKQINAEHKPELEREAEMKGRSPAEVHIQSADERHHCSHCTIAISDMHRGCHCEKDQNQGNSPTKARSVILKRSNDSLSALPITRTQSPKGSPRDCELGHSSSEELLRHGSSDVSGELSCTDREVGGSGNDLTLTIKLETSAEEIVSCYELPEILDKSSGCLFCLGTEKLAGKVKHLKEAARREDASGNFLYYPIMTDFNNDSLEHFQMHWNQGQPVIVQSVLEGAYDLDWNPVAMFCAYLQNSNSKAQNDEADKTTDCSDWFEVDIGVRQFFLGSLRGKADTNTCQEKLKLQGRVPSRLFEEQFPAHYAEVLNILPFPHYMNPKRGLLNIAAKLPLEIQMPDLGPCLNIYYRSGEEFVQPDSVKKLGFEFCDKVDILLHVTETPVSTKEICRVRKLMKRKKAQDRVVDDKERDASKMVNDNVISIHKLRSDNHGKDMKSRVDRAKKQSGFATERCDLIHKDGEGSYSWGSDYHSGSDSESEDRQVQEEQRESCSHSCGEEDLGSSYGVQWDIFRRQDVLKLVEYLKKHSRKQVSHPPLDRSYYLDAYQKTRLKEEFEIEPWTFDQHVGEAVIIPAGCPYQMRKVKSCVNVELDFVSPEHVTASIQRAEEQCHLPHHPKPKGPEIEVKKMAIHKIGEAIREIRRLTSSSE